MSSSRPAIDSELAAALQAMPFGPNGVFDLTDIPATREAVRALAETIAATIPDEPTVTADELHVPRADASDVPLLLLRPRNAPGPLPVIVWFHGGGQVLGFAAQDAPWLKQLSAALGCAVAAVDYRLAPETPAPGAAEDGYAAYRWIGDHAADLGLDPTRVGLAGQSGGAGIAAATALLIRARGAATPLFQMLQYPMLDDRNTTDSSLRITDIGIWDRATNLLAWQAILGDRAGTEDVTPYAAASRATDLTGLPPTFIGVGELDVFRDENLDYAARLRADGVPVELHLYPGAYHAFDLFAPQSHLAESFRHARNNYLARHLTKAPAARAAA
ncbi:alpha/beta hydrolase [Streptomyces sp. NBC_00582]|uniref:alpha/beta hydrolase n=1 Tax=Streptomyces sp. NBC_00582 TaxID=2975783 RepID=UPI0010643282|nr:alpha/beta hydrolase fold domain-containing protein [Streptomyces sp. NBC_00582]WUB59596.1 alpha/beta hydrolase fold domain-containing protein [Streptomyces sp. NBC_00582]